MKLFTIREFRGFESLYDLDEILYDIEEMIEEMGIPAEFDGTLTIEVECKYTESPS